MDRLLWPIVNGLLMVFRPAHRVHILSPYRVHAPYQSNRTEPGHDCRRCNDNTFRSFQNSIAAEGQGLVHSRLFIAFNGDRFAMEYKLCDLVADVNATLGGQNDSPAFNSQRSSLNIQPDLAKHQRVLCKLHHANLLSRSHPKTTVPWQGSQTAIATSNEPHQTCKPLESP